MKAEDHRLLRAWGKFLTIMCAWAGLVGVWVAFVNVTQHLEATQLQVELLVEVQARWAIQMAMLEACPVSTCSTCPTCPVPDAYRELDTHMLLHSMKCDHMIKENRP